MSLKNYSATSLTGGGAGALDAIDGTDLQNLDFAAVFTIDTFYYYVLDVDAGGAESSPVKITPDANAGNKRWILIAILGTGGLQLVDTNSSHTVTIVPASDVSAARTVNLTTGDQDTTLKLSGSSNAFIEGDTTAGRVLRILRFYIQDATAATEIKCWTSSIWNGDAIAEVDNIGKGETVGDFTLGAAGGAVKIEASGLTGNAVAVLSSNIHRNQCQTDLTFKVEVDSNDLEFTPFDVATGATVDLTTLVDTGDIYIDVTYLTDA
jgi:hypothetical protein